jgi:hypothetical protein
MSEKRERDPWQDRYDSDEDETDSETEKAAEMEENSETSKMSKTTETAESDETSGDTVRERKNVNMYLPEELVGDLQLRYSELNVQWRQAHGDDLPKNNEFYPAVIRAALGDSTVEDELGLE